MKTAISKISILTLVYLRKAIAAFLRILSVAYIKFLINKEYSSLIISIIGLAISTTTLLISQAPINNASYEVNHFNLQNLQISDSNRAVPYFDTSFELLVAIINNGNEPISVNNIEAFAMDIPKTRSPRNSDCDQNGLGAPLLLHLYEHAGSVTDAARGTDVTANFGNRTVPPFSVPPYSTIQDLHRFSLFDQLDPSPASIKSLICLDVSITTVSGNVYHRPRLLGIVNATHGFKVDKGWQRIKPPEAPPRPPEDAYDRQTNLPGLKSDIMWLYRGSYWRL